MKMIKDIPIADINTEISLQHRPVDEDTIKRYMDLLKDGYKGFPPVNIVNDGKNNWLYNGFHRFNSYRKLNKKYIPADIESGTKKDAIYFSFHANFDNGLPRQKGAVEKIIKAYLADEEWSKESNRGIADWVGISESTVRYYKKKIEEENNARKAKPKSESGCAQTAQQKPTSDAKNGDSESSKKTDPHSNAENEGAENTSDSLKTPLLDSVGEVIPENLVPVFNRVNEIKTLIHQLNQILKIAKDGVANKDLLWSHCKLNNLEIEMRNAKEVLKFTMPYSVCRFCMGDGKDCRGCGELGFQNEAQYRAVPSELKKQK